MFKMILFILVAIGIIMSVPKLRERAGVALQPAVDKVAPHLKPITDPMKKVHTSDHETEILGGLRQDHIQGRQLPEDDFQGWLKAHQYGRDGWDRPFWMLRRNDSLFVGSNGSDGVKNTPDDMVAGMPW